MTIKQVTKPRISSPVAIGPCRVKVPDLMLDPENPRLPRSLQGADQERLVRYLFEEGALDELAKSFLDSGFFQHEPLLIFFDESYGRYIAIEGNRRLATLKILLNQPEAGELSFTGFDLNRKTREELFEPHCFRIKDRDDVNSYLGFRHIGGLKSWGPEAKSRYVYAEVQKGAKRGDDDPFRSIARRVGLDVASVRNLFLAYAVVDFARTEFSADTSRLEQQSERRFGVWQRCLQSPQIRDYIGLPKSTGYHDIVNAFANLEPKKFKHVLRDVAPPGDERPILEDSRDVTAYARVLANERASAILRKTRDLEQARQLVDEEDLPKRIGRLQRKCDLMMDEVNEAPYSEELAESVESLLKTVRLLRSAVQNKLSADE